MHTQYSTHLYSMRYSQIQSDILSHQTWLQSKSFWIQAVDVIPKLRVSLLYFFVQRQSPDTLTEMRKVRTWVMTVMTQKSHELFLLQRFLDGKYHQVGQKLMSVETNRLAGGWKEANIVYKIHLHKYIYIYIFFVYTPTLLYWTNLPFLPFG